MKGVPGVERLRERRAPLEMRPDEFRAIGHRLVDQIAERLAAVPGGPIVRDETPAMLRALIDAEQALPARGTDAGTLVHEAASLLFDHALFNAHPRFFGYVTSSPAPIGMFGDFLAAALNQNVGAWRLSPLATEIEAQVVRWIAGLIGYPPAAGGLLVSGGNMANIICFATARTAVAPGARRRGLPACPRALKVYASAETHAWIHKAADLCGLGTDAVRWVPTDADQRMDIGALRGLVDEDERLGHQPFLVVGTGGSVSTGAVDPLAEMAATCRERGLWFHVDGAYGALAALAPGAPEALRAVAEADSVAVDPHKWLYAPLEAGCVLVRDPARLRDAFSYHPPYYRFDDQAVNYFDYGPQNSRGFRALKIWLSLRQVGRDACLRMIGDDMLLARHLHALVSAHPAFEPATQHLSVTTFRYVPPDLRAHVGVEATEVYLNELNETLLAAVQVGGDTFLSNAVVDGRFLLRACVVNFHTALADIEALPPLLARMGEAADAPRSRTC
ncbi:MAG: aspartate aminotransferase family protein [Vicinamibacterales bacterium]